MIENLVSTIIPVHNRPAQLREAVASVLAQDWRPLEVIVVDDGSTDDTLQVARQLASGHGDLVRVLSQANAGPGCAREHGRLHARGEFIQYLDSDDVLLPGKFAAQVGALRAHPECAVAYGWTRFRHADGRIEPRPWKGSGARQEAMFPSFLVERWWDTPNPLYRRQICDAAGPWTDLRLEEDWEYDCRIASLGARLAWHQAYVCEVRDHAGPKLGVGDGYDAQRLAQRARSHGLVFGHALRARLDPGAPEMRRFARSLFLLARQCGAAGLPRESAGLLALARRASGPREAADMRIYAGLAHVFGWKAAGRASRWLDARRAG